MVANPERRAALLDAAIDCLGSGGARALTFRKVERRAGVPTGTASNYFASRTALLLAVVEHVFSRLAPRPEDVKPPVGAAEAARHFVVGVVTRLYRQPVLALALVELRLEAARAPDVAAALRPFLAQAFADDVAFHTGQALPGGARTVELLHYAVSGLVLDKLTTPLTDSDITELAEDLAVRLVAEESATRDDQYVHRAPIKSHRAQRAE